MLSDCDFRQTDDGCDISPKCITTTFLPAGATTSCLIFDGDGVLEGHPRMTIGSVFRHLSSNDHSAFPSISRTHRQCSAVLQPPMIDPQDWHACASSLDNLRAHFSAPPSLTLFAFAILRELQLPHRTRLDCLVRKILSSATSIGRCLCFSLGPPSLWLEQECRCPQG